MIWPDMGKEGWYERQMAEIANKRSRDLFQVTMLVMAVFFIVVAIVAVLSIIVLSIPLITLIYTVKGLIWMAS